MLVLATLLASGAGVTACRDGREGVAEDPTARPADLGQASELLAAEQWDRATDVLRTILATAPQNGQAWLLLSQAHRSAGRYEEALSAAAAAATTDATRPRAHQSTFLTHVAAADLDAAAESYSVLRNSPSTDLSAIHLAADLSSLRSDERFAELFPHDFDAAFVEDHAVLHDWRGEGNGQAFGWEARNIGDVDGDGANDAVVSAPGIAPGGDAAGRVYAYSGRSGELLWMVDGNAGDQLGMGIEAAGDVDGDGVPDVVAGAPGIGRVQVLAGRTGAVLHTLDAGSADASFGSAVAGVGDVDGDGHGDILVGSSGSAEGAGRAYLYSGADGHTLLTLEGEAGDALGSVVAGSSKGDSILLVVGAPGAGENDQGQVRVYADLSGAPAFTIDAVPSGRQLGAMFASVVGDINGDGKLDVYASDWADTSLGPATGRIYVHSGADGSRLLTLSGEAAGDGFGIGPARAGDVNGDGYDDLVIGAWQHGSAAHSGGKVYVYSGKDAGLLLTFTGKVAGETLGFDADGMGDVNGDGNADFLVTSAWSLVNGPRSGRTLIVSAGS